MTIRTREQETFEIADHERVYLPEGLLGFEDLHEFALIDREEFRPFAWLVSTENPEVGFAVTDPDRFRAGAYEVSLSDSDESLLDLEEADAIAVFVIVTLGVNGSRSTGNLRAPIVMNTRNRVAKQIIVYGSGLSVRQAMLNRRLVPLHGAVGNVTARE